MIVVRIVALVAAAFLFLNLMAWAFGIEPTWQEILVVVGGIMVLGFVNSLVKELIR
jgi:hypothetical protein